MKLADLLILGLGGFALYKLTQKKTPDNAPTGSQLATRPQPTTVETAFTSGNYVSSNAFTIQK